MNGVFIHTTRPRSLAADRFGRPALLLGVATISGNRLGWMPTSTSLGTGATLGATVTPPALGPSTTAAVLAQAGNGFGASVLGSYTSSLTVTAVTSLP